MKIRLIAIAAILLTAFVVLAGTPRQPKKPQRVATQSGISATNALAEVTAILKQMPKGNTILDISFASSEKIQVRVCGKDTTKGCTLNYEKKGAEWKLGVMAHWRSEQSPRTYSSKAANGLTGNAQEWRSPAKQELKGPVRRDTLQA